VAFIKCEVCGKQHSDKAPECPFCKGRPPAPPSPPISARVLPAIKMLGKGSVTVKKALFRYKKYKADCPMCSVNLTMKIEADTQPEEYPPDMFVKKLGIGDCPFCKIELAIVVDEDGVVQFRDSKWDAIEKRHDDQYDAIENEIAELEFTLEDDEDEDGTLLTQKQQSAIERKIKTLKKRLEKLDESFGDRSDRYYDRQMRWQEKADRKFGGES